MEKQIPLQLTYTHQASKAIKSEQLYQEFIKQVLLLEEIKLVTKQEPV